MTSEAPRIVGIDVARGLAILGMFVAHAIPRAGDAELLVDGRSSILFATLAGVSLGIMTGSERPLRRGNRSDRVIGIVLRALILFVLGVILSTLGSEIAVILDYYAIMFILLVPMLFLPRGALAVIAAIFVFAAPTLALAADPVSASAPRTLYFLQYYLLTGYYPVLIWIPFLIAGLLAARSGLSREKTQVWMMGAGLSAALVGYGAAEIVPSLTSEAHSGSIAEVMGSGGFAIALIGAVLWVTSAERGGFGRATRRILSPIGATGSMALTVYTLQIVTLAIFVQLRGATDGAVQYPGWPLLIGMTLASVILASLWRRFLGKGPFERMIATLTRPPRAAQPA